MKKVLTLQIVRLTWVWQTVPELSLTALFLLNKWAFQSKEKQISSPDSFVYKSSHFLPITLIYPWPPQKQLSQIFSKKIKSQNVYNAITMWHKSALAKSKVSLSLFRDIVHNYDHSFSYFLKFFFVCFQVSIFIALIGIKHSLFTVTSHPQTRLHHGVAVIEMFSNLTWAPDFFSGHEIWAPRSLGPKKFGPKKPRCPNKNWDHFSCTPIFYISYAEKNINRQNRL